MYALIATVMIGKTTDEKRIIGLQERVTNLDHDSVNEAHR